GCEWEDKSLIVVVPAPIRIPDLGAEGIALAPGEQERRRVEEHANRLFRPEVGELSKHARLGHRPAASDADELGRERDPHLAREVIADVREHQHERAILVVDIQDHVGRALGGTAHSSISKPSWQISSSSIATSFERPFSAGPSHLQGQPRRNTNRITSWRLSSSTTIAPFARRTRASRAALNHCQSARSLVLPRLSVMLEYLTSPGSLRTVMSSEPLRYSMTAISAPIPETSANDARAMPSISTRKFC